MQVQEEVQSLMMGGGGRRPQLHSTSVDNAFSVDHLKDQQKLMDVNLLSKRESSSIYPRISLGNGQYLETSRELCYSHKSWPQVASLHPRVLITKQRQVFHFAFE